jgi:hypothetical protein
MADRNIVFFAGLDDLSHRFEKRRMIVLTRMA